MLKETEFIKNYIKKSRMQTKHSLNFEDDVAVVNNFAYSQIPFQKIYISLAMMILKQ